MSVSTRQAVGASPTGTQCTASTLAWQPVLWVLPELAHPRVCHGLSVPHQASEAEGKLAYRGSVVLPP